jgi:dihydropteroate synthase
MRPRTTWRLRSRSLSLGERTLVMGVVNVTPDSFSDAGESADPEVAVAHALELLREGADIIDIGGESTRPGAKVREQATVDEQDEQRRILPVIKDVLRERPDTLISVDTYRAATARRAIEAGAEIVNDVSGGTWDAGMLAALAELRCGVVLMHMRGRPEEWRTLPVLDDPVATVKADLAKIVRAADRAGMERDRIALDPGFGFGKRFDENYPLLAHLGELSSLGFPLLAGTSRKGFIGQTLRCGDELRPATGRLFGTLATVTAAILQGAHIIRVHDVAAARDAALVADEILKAKR